VTNAMTSPLKTAVLGCAERAHSFQIVDQKLGANAASMLNRHMKALVRRPNVYCKLSGLVEGTGRSDGAAPRDVEFYRPVLDAMREIFGAERLIYASNWPVSERFAPLATVQGIVADYFRSYGRNMEEKIFALSAKAAY